LSALRFRFDYLGEEDRVIRHGEGEAIAAIPDWYLGKRQILVGWQDNDERTSSARQHIIA
jgi:hypothetical protein